MAGRIVLGVLLAIGLAAVAYDVFFVVEEVKETKERFDTVDEKLKSMMPQARGLAPTPSFSDDTLTVKIKVFRRDMEDSEKAYTLIKIDNDKQTYSLPRGWQGRLQETEDRLAAYDRTMAEVKAVVRGKIAAHGAPAEEVKGEIHAPPPSGPEVPHGDIVQVLNVFLEVGMMDVVVEGAASPLTSRERAARMRDARGQAPRGDGR